MPTRGNHALYRKGDRDVVSRQTHATGPRTLCSASMSEPASVWRLPLGNEQGTASVSRSSPWMVAMATAPAPVKKPAIKRLILRRRAKRDSLWPDAPGVVFTPATGGWAQMPRTVPMIASLVDELGGRDKAGRLYITLWAYELGDGFVEVPDPAQLALEAGYVTNRAERTFNERIAILRGLGLLRTARLGLREHGFVLLLDPHLVVAGIRDQNPDSVPERWWTAFVSRCGNIGIRLPGDVGPEEQAEAETPPPHESATVDPPAPAAPSPPRVFNIPKGLVPLQQAKPLDAKRKES